jgi:hypothetical protein
MIEEMQKLWTPHPVMGLPETREGALALQERLGGPGKLLEWLRLRHSKIEAEKSDPFRHGWEPQMWQDARALLKEGSDLLILGGNRSTKTEFASKATVKALCLGENKNAWAFQSTERASIERQHNMVFKYLPAEWKDIGKQGHVTYVKYTKANGFSEGRFVLPNGSYGRFMNYEMGLDTLEGYELDICWCDELVTVEFLDTLQYRLVTRAGKLVVTFTPIRGYTMAVARYLHGAKIRETRRAELLPQDEVLVPGCPRGHMPYILECAKPGRFVICFFTQENPYNDWSEMQKMLAGAPKQEIMIRAYGWTDKLVASALARFADVHIVPPESVPLEGTNYLLADPAGARNWFLLWFRVDSMGRVFVYREWPDESYGEWALPDKKPDGKEGPAQREGCGRGIAEYKEIILDCEGNGRNGNNGSDGNYAERICRRMMDPRGGMAAVPGQEEGTTIIELMEDETVDRAGGKHAPMFFEQAPACGIQEGIQLVNEWLAFDDELPVSILNAPKLYVSSACKNTIYCMRVWTGRDGEKGASKDPIDLLRYAAKAPLEWVDEKAPMSVGGTGW